MSKIRVDFHSPFVVTLDVGSSSVRAMVFDASGQPVDHLDHEIEHRVHTTSDGGAELDAEAVLVRCLDCLRALAAQRKFRRLRREVAAVGASMFMHTLVGTDRAGRALTPLYMWSDTRSRIVLDKGVRPLEADALHQQTGCPLHSSFPLAKLLWLRKTRPALFRRVRRWLSMGDYLHLRLFGRPSISYSMASGSGLFATRELRWDEEALRIAGVRAGQLGELVDYDQANEGVARRFRNDLGRLARVPWLPAMADGVCSNVGSDCIDDTRFALNLGTSAAMRAITRQRIGRVPAGLFRYRVDRHAVLIGGASSNCGNLRRWLLETLRVRKRSKLENDLARMKPCAHGLTVLPFLSGERAPFWSSGLTGAVLGLRSATTANDIARATFESMSFQLALIHERLRDTLPRARTLVVSGGGSGSDWWMQMLADVMRTPVRVSSISEASSRGTALLALKALGADAAVDRNRAGREMVFTPESRRARIYSAALDRYRSLATRSFPAT